MQVSYEEILKPIHPIAEKKEVKEAVERMENEGNIPQKAVTLNFLSCIIGTTAQAAKALKALQDIGFLKQNISIYSLSQEDLKKLKQEKGNLLISVITEEEEKNKREKAHMIFKSIDAFQIFETKEEYKNTYVFSESSLNELYNL